MQIWKIKFAKGFLRDSDQECGKRFYETNLRWKSVFITSYVSDIRPYNIIFIDIILANIRPDEDVVKQIALDLPRTSRWLVSENSGLASKIFLLAVFRGNA